MKEPKKVLYKFDNDDTNDGFFAIEVEEYETPTNSKNGHYDENVTRGRKKDMDEKFKEAETTFQKALSPLKAVWKGLDNILEDVAPDEATIEMGVKIAGRAGVPFVIMADKDVHFKVTLKWSREQKKTEKQ